jgi:hypothetical protein
MLAEVLVEWQPLLEGVPVLGRPIRIPIDSLGLENEDRAAKGLRS